MIKSAKVEEARKKVEEIKTKIEKGEDKYKWEYRNALRIIMMQSVGYLVLSLIMLVMAIIMTVGGIGRAIVILIFTFLQCAISIRALFRAGKRQAMEEQKNLFESESK